METKHRLVLKHESGLYLSASVDEFPHTKQIARARRFLNAEQVAAFIQTSTYAPEVPDEYEIVEIEISYKERESDVRVSESPTEAVSGN